MHTVSAAVGAGKTSYSYALMLALNDHFIINLLAVSALLT
jgi:hypothetical protein